MKWVPMVLISVAGFPPLRSPPRSHLGKVLRSVLRARKPIMVTIRRVRRIATGAEHNSALGAANTVRVEVLKVPAAEGQTIAPHHSFRGLAGSIRQRAGYDSLDGELAGYAGAPDIGRVIVDQVLEGGGEVRFKLHRCQKLPQVPHVQRQRCLPYKLLGHVAPAATSPQRRHSQIDFPLDPCPPYIFPATRRPATRRRSPVNEDGLADAFEAEAVVAGCTRKHKKVQSGIRCQISAWVVATTVNIRVSQCVYSPA